MKPNVTDKVVFRSDDLEVIACAGASDFLMVTFSEMGMRPNGRRWWGQTAGHKLGVNALGFVAVRPNWFPDQAMAEALSAPAVLAVLDAHPRRVAYGFSMGGYGVLRHAQAVGATASIAISPQWSIDPADTAGHDSRFSRYFDPARNPAMRIAPDAALPMDTFLIFDPAEIADRWHVARIRDAVPHAVPLAARATGHWTSRALAGSEMVGRLMRHALAGDVAAMRLDIAAKRRAWPWRPIVLARQLARMRPRLAMGIAERHGSVAEGDELSMIFERVADSFLQAGDAESAGHAARQALAIAPGSSRATGLLARSAMRLGHTDFALEMARRSVDLAPDKPAARLLLATLLRRAGQHDAAAAETLRAQELAARG